MNNWTADNNGDEIESYKKAGGSAGITAAGDVTFGDISSLFVVGETNIVIQEQSIGNAGLEELRKNLLYFRNGVAKLGLSSGDQSIVNGKISEAVKEANEKNSALSGIKERFESAINTVKEAGKTLKNISELYEPAKKIAKLVGIGLSFLL